MKLLGIEGMKSDKVAVVLNQKELAMLMNVLGHSNVPRSLEMYQEFCSFVERVHEDT